MLLQGFISVVLLSSVCGFLPHRFGVSWKAQVAKPITRSIQTSLRDLRDISQVAFDSCGRTFITHCVLEGDGGTERMLASDLGPYTLFLPEEECFKDDMLHGEMPSKTFVDYHIMHGRIEAPTAPETIYTMLNGQNITVTVQGNDTFVHGVHNTPRRMLDRNIKCANGFIHVIESFLLPDYAEYEPGPYNVSLYNITHDVFVPQKLDYSNIPIPDGWYEEDDPQYEEYMANKTRNAASGNSSEFSAAAFGLVYSSTSHDGGSKGSRGSDDSSSSFVSSDGRGTSSVEDDANAYYASMSGSSGGSSVDKSSGGSSGADDSNAFHARMSGSSNSGANSVDADDSYAYNARMSGGGGSSGGSVESTDANSVDVDDLNAYYARMSGGNIDATGSGGGGGGDSSDSDTSGGADDSNAYYARMSGSSGVGSSSDNSGESSNCDSTADYNDAYSRYMRGYAPNSESVASSLE